MKTLLFGLDGATFTVLDHLVALGIMPNLGKFLEQACRAPLASTALPVTPQAWTSMSTSRTAGHHGLHDFIRREQSGSTVFWRVNDARDNHCETIWKYASRNDLRVTVLNYFGVAPPEPINGHSMPGFVSGRHLRRSTWPSDLFARLQELPGLDMKILGLDLDVERLALQDMAIDDWAPWIRHHIQREQAWFRVLEHLMIHEPSDLTAIVLDGVDKIQHLAWRYLDPALLPAAPTAWEQEIIELVRSYFRQVDDFLGRLVDLVGPAARVVIASDHGFTQTTEVVYINRWLADQGWLTFREQVAEDDTNALFSPRLADLANAIDLDRTKAYALLPSCNGIYLNVGPEEHAAFRAELVERLSTLRGPDGGQVITEVKLREEWFPGPYMDRIPDLTLTLRDHGFISVLNAATAVTPRPRPSGTHHPHGVVVVSGPGVRAGSQAGLQSILDIAPLLAHSLELPVPEKYEGRFPEAMFEESFLQERPLSIGQASAPVGAWDGELAAVSEEDDQAIILERLKSLGYIE